MSTDNSKEMRSLSDAALVALLYRALIGVKRGDCWCDVAIGNPMMGGKHDTHCLVAQEAIKEARRG